MAVPPTYWGEEITIGASGTSAKYSDVAYLDNGLIVVVWTSYGGTIGDTSEGSIRGQLLWPDGTPYGEEFQVNTTTNGEQRKPSIAARGNSFLVAWEDGSAGGGDVRARKYGVDM